MEIVTGLCTATGLLPFAFLVFAGLLQLAQGVDTPRAVIDAFVAWAVTSYLSAEILSLFRSIAYLPILIVWILAIGFTVTQLWKNRQAVRLNTGYPRDIAFFIVVLFGTVTLLIALTAEPNNWDSQSYHLPRIEHWNQNGSLEHYPTAIRRQIAYAPLAEILLLHTRVLAGSDAFYLLIQWVSMLCSLFAVFRITQQLGGTETQSWIAAVFVATLPMGILQSTSTQNDYVTAALLCCFVSLGLQMIEEPMLRPQTMIEAVTAGALSGIVKPVGYIVGASFAIWFSVVLLRRLTFASFIKWGVAAAVIFVVIVGPFAARNLSTYGSIQSDAWVVTTNKSFGLKQTLDNLILNTALNFATGNPRIDQFTTRLALEITASLGLDTYRADTLIGRQEFTLPTGRSVYHEDFGPNPVHTLLVIAALVSTATRWRRLGSPLRLKYWCAWFAGIMLFASVLRWQPWAVRYHISGFALTAPVAAIAWPEWQLRARSTIILLLILALCGLPTLLFNTSRQLVPLRNRPSYLGQEALKRLFENRRGHLNAYAEAVDVLIQSKASQIGLLTLGDDWEYPLWRMLRDRKPAYPIRIEHITDQAEARSWPLGPFIPDAIVWMRTEPPPRLTVGAREFAPHGPPGPVTVYLSVTSSPAGQQN